MAGGTLYFHASCFDGAASAALAADVLERVLAWTGCRLAPVNYDARPHWRATPTGRFAVVDFLYHPSAEFWADHHASPFLDPGDEQHADSRSDGRALYDASARSCARVVWSRYEAVLRERFPAPAELVAWADKIDSAAYESVEEALFSTAPALAVSRALAQADSSPMIEIVEKLRREGLDAVARAPRVAELSSRWLAGQDAALRVFRTRARLTDDGLVLYEVDDPHGSFSRYLPFAVFPAARYSLGLVETPSGRKLTAMRNPWLEFESVPLGAIFARLGGGGHHRIGSALLPRVSREEALRSMGEVEGIIAGSERARRDGGEACTSASTSTTSTRTSSPA